MVEGLLDFGRMDSGRRSYEFSETDASDLVRLVVQEFTERVPEAAPRIEVATQPGHAARLPIVRADREALALAVRNLLDNALKYSPSSAKVLVSVAAASGSVTIAVEDHGPGIPAQEQREIFRKFARGAAARDLNVKGTGIGLAMVDQIVKAHAGRLALVSEPGRGSRFTIELRAQQA